MAAITCGPDGKTIPLGPSETILEAVLRADIPHAHACGGRAKCSTCRIVILEGLENCSPRTETEQAMASRLGFALEVRLACQTKTQGDVSFRRLVLDETDREIASQLLKKRTGPVGESKPIAVLFSDIRGFTTLAQRLSPYDVMFAILARRFLLQRPIDTAHCSSPRARQSCSFVSSFSVKHPGSEPPLPTRGRTR